MKSLNTKLALSALAIAVLATPALAASKHQPQVQTYQSYEGLQNSAVGTGANPASAPIRTARPAAAASTRANPARTTTSFAKFVRSVCALLEALDLGPGLLALKRPGRAGICI